MYQLSAIETQAYTSVVRNFYMNTIYIVMAILGVLLAFLVYVGAKYEKMRKVWYRRHTLRATYVSRLMQDKEKTRALQDNWEKIAAMAEEEMPEKWKEVFVLLDETLEGVLTLLRFNDGENLTEKLQNMGEDDLWCIEKLWEAHSLILRTQKKMEKEDGPAITKKVLTKVVEIYKIAFIWLGLLPHHLAVDE